MEYTITNKQMETTAKGARYTLQMDSRAPLYQCTVLAVTREQFEAVNVGEKLTLDIASVVPTAVEEEATVA